MPPMPSRTGNKKISTVDHSDEDKELVRKYLFEGGSTPLLRSSSPEGDDHDVSEDLDFTVAGSSTRPRLVVETARLPSKAKKAQKEKPKELGPPPPRSPSIRAAHEEPDVFTDEEDDDRAALQSPFLEKNHEGKLLLHSGMGAFTDSRASYSPAATLSDEESPIGSQSSLKRSREDVSAASTPEPEEVMEGYHHQRKKQEACFDFDLQDMDSPFNEMSPYVLSSQGSLPQEEDSQRQDGYYSDLAIDQDIMADGRRGSASMEVAMSTQTGSAGEERGINETRTGIEQDMMLMTTLGEDEQPILAEIWLGHSFDHHHQEEDFEYSH